MNESGELMRKVVLGVASVLVVPLAAVSGVGVARVVAGGNVSDVGVPMYAHGQMAVVAGALARVVRGRLRRHAPVAHAAPRAAIRTRG